MKNQARQLNQITEATLKFAVLYLVANRLTVERNPKFDRTYLYSYDSRGNILSKKEYAYADSGLGEFIREDAAQYDRRDQLGSWGGKQFEYDACGNPVLYKGDTMSWTRGRLLESYTKGGYFYVFDYDANGERFVKKLGEKITKYYSMSGKLMREERADGTIINFLYGSDGIIGCVVDGTIYFYAKNMFGDVVAIYDYNTGAPVARYAYDAWGNHKVLNVEGSENISPKFIGHINPIRYRSYYWDSDVQLYYLHTRWYDPEIGRFINMDQIEYLDPETVNGLNLYAYCLNNPVMGVDPNGKIPFASFYFRSYIETLIWGFDSKWFGRFAISKTFISAQTSEAGFFYSYQANNMANLENSVGAGINAWGWIGLEVYGNTEWNVGYQINITPWFHFGASFGLDGITYNAGITIDDATYDFIFGIGWGTVAVLAVTATLIKGFLGAVAALGLLAA